MTVSVVIPCYNQGGYLRDAVRSAASHHVRTEVIVVDDGSTDDTPLILSRLNHVIAIRQENRGLAAARNRGFAAASGQLVIFLDADDRLLPGGVDAGVRALARHTAAAMAYGRCVMMGPDGQPQPTPEQPAVRCGHYAALLRTNFIWMPAMAIFRREIVERMGGFAAGVDGAADYDLYLRIARGHPLHDHGQIVAAYRRHDASMSGDAARMLRETLCVMRRNRPDSRDAFAAAWHDGFAAWQDFYGTQLTEEIRTHVRARQIGRAFGKTLALAELAPGVLTREARRKLRATYAGRAIPAAEMSPPSRRAET